MTYFSFKSFSESHSAPRFRQCNSKAFNYTTQTKTVNRLQLQWWISGTNLIRSTGWSI